MTRAPAAAAHPPRLGRSREPALGSVRATSSTSTARSPARARSRDVDRRRGRVGLRHDLQPRPARSSSREPRPATRSRSRSSSSPPARGGGRPSCPGLGLLADDFPDPFLKVFDLRGGAAATRRPGVEVPLDPFLGTMGVVTDEPGQHSPFPPHRGGGNVDCRHLVVGSTLWLPIWCEGALFSCGDAHGAQGDGEVCVSAIECAMEATLRFRLHKRSIAGPAVPRATRGRDPGPALRDDGHRPDLMEGARTAVRNMIAWLVDEHGPDARGRVRPLQPRRRHLGSTRSSTPASGTSAW